MLNYEVKQITIGDYLTELEPITNDNPVGQRPPVQTNRLGTNKPSKAQSIIAAIIDEYDIGEIKLIQVDNSKFKLESIDGGNRKREIKNFVNGKFPVHKSHKEYGDKYFSQLPEEIRKQFMSYELRFIIYKDKTSYWKGKQFRVFNTTTPVNHQEMLNSYGDTPIAKIVRETVREIEEENNSPHILFKSKLSPKGDDYIFEHISSDNSRLKLEEYVARILLQFWRGSKLLNTATNDDLETMYSDISITPEKAEKLKDKLNKFLYMIMDLSRAKMKKNSNRGLGYRELVMASRLFFYLLDKHKSFKVVDYDQLWLDFTNTLNAYIGKAPTKTDTHTDDKGTRTKSDAMRGYLGDYKSIKKVETTVEWLLEDLDIESHIITQDEQRAFSRELIEQVLAKQEYKDYVDGKPLTMDDAEGAHIVPWSQGGRTTVDNLAVTSKYHNKAMGTLNVEAYKIHYNNKNS
jgi:hypothetical protein